MSSLLSVPTVELDVFQFPRDKPTRNHHIGPADRWRNFSKHNGTPVTNLGLTSVQEAKQSKWKGRVHRKHGTFFASILKCQKKCTCHIYDKRIILLVFKEILQICKTKIDPSRDINKNTQIRNHKRSNKMAKKPHNRTLPFRGWELHMCDLIYRPKWPYGSSTSQKYLGRWSMPRISKHINWAWPADLNSGLLATELHCRD